MRVDHRVVVVRPRRVLFLAFVVVICSLGLASLLLSSSSLQPPGIDQKDIRQEWLLAKSVTGRRDPYGLADGSPGGTDALASGFDVPLLLHPPTDGLVFASATLVPYRVFATAWFWIEVVSLFASANLLRRVIQPGAQFSAGLVGGLALLSWSAVATELRLGQLMLVILLLLLLARGALGADRQALAGVLIGITILLKPLLWPVAVLFALRQAIRFVVSLATLVGISYLVVIALIGARATELYFLVTGPATARVLGPWVLNISTWAIGSKIFVGTYAPGMQNWLTAPPVMSSPTLAGVTTVVLPAALLMIALVAAMRRRDVDDALAIVVCASILASPLAWEIDVVLAAFPVARVVRRLYVQRYPRWMFALLAAIVAALLPSSAQWMMLAAALSGQHFSPAESLVVPSALAFLPMVPTVALLGLIGLLIILDRVPAPITRDAQTG